MSVVESDTELKQAPENAFVHCPMKNFMLSRVEHCIKCQHSHGLLRIQEGGEFIQEFRLACAHPIARRMEIVNI